MKSVLLVPNVLRRKHCACSSDSTVTHPLTEKNRQEASVCVSIALATSCEIMNIRHRHNHLSERQFY